jgi:enoyl-CoA hydratase/carnithine racemase
VVGAVERAAIAGGSALCFACDFIVAERARASAPPKLAWEWPGAGQPRLADHPLGYNAAVQIAQSAKSLRASSDEMGLAYAWAPDDKVLETARALADELCQNLLPAMANMKRVIQRERRRLPIAPPSRIQGR